MKRERPGRQDRVSKEREEGDETREMEGMPLGMML